MTKLQREKSAIDRMGRLHNSILEIINHSKLSFSENLMVIEIVKNKLVEGFVLETKANEVE